MSTRIRVAVFVLVALLQWALPLGLILQHERTLAEGAVYRFRAAPVDPVDPFRGRYVALAFAADTYAVPPGWVAPAGPAYAPVVVTPAGEAILGPPQAIPPSEGDALPVQILWHEDDRIQVRLPFDRYYLGEQRAPEVERLYRDAAGPPSEDELMSANAHLQVRIRGGHAVLEDLLIDGRSVGRRATADP